jgi:8-oxo-dGTP pyrophosphatase MutT (NUDIX family)
MSAKRTTTHGLPAIWQMVRLSVAEAGYVLDLNVYERLRSLFVESYASGDGSQLAAITREFLQDEYLLVVDAAGQPVLPEQSIVADFEVMLQAHPSFSRWFQMDTVAEGPGSPQPVLLVARWLCHLSGLRHVTVELFLDLPDRPGATLVQIRGLAKNESPGDFDLPCAGHISGVDGIAASMAKELEEELGLRIDDLADFREVRRFDAPSGSDPRPRNHEFRVLYQACLKPDRLARIRLREDEVAGLALISLPELRRLVELYPERVASGLKEAISMYEE